MYKYYITKNIVPKNWNNDLTKNEFANFFQTAEFLKSQLINESNSLRFINIEDSKGNVKGQLGIIITKQENAYSSQFLSQIFKIFSSLGKRGTWAAGPIIHEEDIIEKNKILDKIFEAIQEIQREEDLSIIDGFTTSDTQIDKRFLDKFRDKGFSIENFQTYTTDLSQDLEDIWKKIHNSTRRDVNRAKKNGLYVKELTEFSELGSYFEIGKIWAKTKGIELKISEKQKEAYWNNLKSGIEKIFLVFDKDELVSTHRLGCFNKIAFSHKVTNSYSKPSSLGGPLVTWHAIEWAKNTGMKYYDFSGGQTSPKEKNKEKQYLSQWKDLLDYKKKWGGNEFHYYHIVKVFHPKKYKFFRILNKFDWSYREYKRKRFRRPKAN